MGSNSFRLQVGRIVGNQIYPLDGLKETVRLAAGLTPDKHLDEASQQRALAALAQFGERLRDFAPDAVRAVATDTLRVARNAPQFLRQAEAALGFPIEIIAGREEARLIYLGVAHSLPNPQIRSLIVDIGGGSTECIIGQNIKPLQLESLYMGCVNFSLRFFPEGRVNKRGMQEAELAASRELQTIVKAYRDTRWDAAVGSSGTAKAICDILALNAYADGTITRRGLERLRNRLVQAGGAAHSGLKGMRSDRIPVIAGGVAIMSAVFKEFDLDEMSFSEGALRLGVLYDLLGRYHHEDMREATVKRFMQRYEVDAQQAERVCKMALKLFRQLRSTDLVEDSATAKLLAWAARLAEVGVSVAHAGFHKHSAYVLANADMPGFSKRDQAMLSRLVLAQRGKLERVQALMEMPPRARPTGEGLLRGGPAGAYALPDYLPIFCLRVAALLHRARDDAPVPEVEVSITAKGYELHIDRAWLANAPLTAAVLASEAEQWASVDIEFRVRARQWRAAAD